jgi:poly(ribitol-phosphate) beta-N-acetylglucosaminyltransferase
VTTAPNRLTVALPFHVPVESEATVKLTNVVTSRSVDLSATLTARGTSAELSVPLGELVDGRWRLELILPSTGVGKPVALPLALDVSASGAVVEHLAAAAAHLAAKRPGRRSPASRLAASKFLRRAAGRLRRALKK